MSSQECPDDGEESWAEALWRSCCPPLFGGARAPCEPHRARSTWSMSTERSDARDSPTAQLHSAAPSQEHSHNSASLPASAVLRVSFTAAGSIRLVPS